MRAECEPGGFGGLRGRAQHAQVRRACSDQTKPSRGSRPAFPATVTSLRELGLMLPPGWGWETMCSQPRGAGSGPPSRNGHALLLRGVNELCPNDGKRPLAVTSLRGAGRGTGGKSSGVREMDQKTISTSLARWFQMCGNRTRSRAPTVTEHYYHAMP